MKGVELYGRVRYAVQIEGLSHRETARRFGLDPRTVAKMVRFSVPPGYVRKKPPAKPKLDPFIAVIDRILGDDKSRPKKQQHTAKRVFERLRDEYGFTGGITIVKDYVAGWRQRMQEMFVPLVHPPGHAQADFGEAIGIIGGVECKIHFFAFDLPHSDACFVVGYPAETTEAFCDGHVRAFAFFGGVPQSILYDNTKIAVARILGDGKRQRTRVFTELQSHYLFEDRFGRPGKGNDKGKVEGLVGYARRNFLVPIPVFESFEALNSYLLECCRHRMADCLRGRDGTIGERLERDLAAFQTPLPAPYDACEKVATTVSSLSLVRYRLNDYSVPTIYGHRDVLVRGYVHEVGSLTSVNLREWETLRPDPGSVLYQQSFSAYPAGRRLAEELTKAGRMKIFELTRGLELQATSFVGRILIGDMTVTVHPKISGAPLLNLFRYAYGLRNLELYGDANFASARWTFQDLLVQQLAAEVTELLKRGIQRDYECVRSDLANPRGRIDFTRYSIAPRAQTTLPCVYYPRSEDTLLNRTLLAGLNLGASLATDLELKSHVRRIAKMLGAIVLIEMRWWAHQGSNLGLGLPVFRALSLCTCRRHYPGAASERCFAHFIQTYQSSPIGLSGRPAHCPFRGLLGVHTRCGLHTCAVTNLRHANRRLQPLRYLHDCSDCFRLERLPDGICTHWKAPPLHGAHPERTLL
jgi:transposase